MYVCVTEEVHALCVCDRGGARAVCVCVTEEVHALCVCDRGGARASGGRVRAVGRQIGGGHLGDLAARLSHRLRRSRRSGRLPYAGAEVMKTLCVCVCVCVCLCMCMCVCVCV